MSYTQSEDHSISEMNSFLTIGDVRRLKLSISSLLGDCNMMTLLSKQLSRGKQLNCCNHKLLRNDLEKGNKQIGSIPDLVENNPDSRGLMGDDVNESSDSSSSSASSTSSTSSSDEETDSEQNTTTKHVTSQDVYNDDQGEDNGATLMMEPQPRLMVL
jgi:hypothetical protein